MRSSTVIRRSAPTVRNDAKDDPVAVQVAPKSNRYYPRSARHGGLSLHRRKPHNSRKKDWTWIIWALPLVACFLVLSEYFDFGLSRVLSTRAPRAYRVHTDLRVVLAHHGTQGVQPPRSTEILQEDGFLIADFGPLVVSQLDSSSEEAARQILYAPDAAGTLKFKPADDRTLTVQKSWDAYYYAFDDDTMRSPYTVFKDKTVEKENHCRRTSWHRDTFPNCNDFHALGVTSRALAHGMKYLGGGSYRSVFRLEADTSSPTVVLKIAQSGLKYKTRAYEYMRVEGAVAEALTPHPSLVDVYGFCALGLMVEPMSNGDANEAAVPIYERDNCQEAVVDGPELVPMNNLEPHTKLEWALQMAEGLANLHNHARGLIIHDDVQLPQFMVTDDGRLKLGDFNRAEFILYDEEHGRYCKYLNGEGAGDWRSPEEYRDDPLDEKIDIWSLGMNFYSLLTGLFPYHDECNEGKVAGLVLDGKLPFLDERWKDNSPEEAALIRVMTSCWAQKSTDRPSIGQIVTRLRQEIDQLRELS